MNIQQILAQFEPICTPRLMMRKITRDDATQLYKLTSSPEMTKYLHWYPSQSLSAVKVVIEQRLTEYKTGETRALVLAIADLHTNQLVGNIAYKLTDRAGLTCEIGYWLGKEYWHQGYASEALKACLHYGFTVLGFERIQCCCSPENIASWRVMERAGMQCEGILRNSYYLKGKLYDDKVYALLKAEYQALQAQATD
ncbi:MAG TPA: GNAT family protein [Oscillospiraceae bacterium]|nr:GNAT family protein [Oscillospiraceae bacterium]